MEFWLICKHNLLASRCWVSAMCKLCYKGLGGIWNEDILLSRVSCDWWGWRCLLFIMTQDPREAALRMAPGKGRDAEAERRIRVSGKHLTPAGSIAELLTNSSAYCPTCACFPEPALYKPSLIRHLGKGKEQSVPVRCRQYPCPHGQRETGAGGPGLRPPWQAHPSHGGLMWPGMLWRPQGRIHFECYEFWSLTRDPCLYQGFNQNSCSEF